MLGVPREGWKSGASFQLGGVLEPETCLPILLLGPTSAASVSPTISAASIWEKEKKNRDPTDKGSAEVRESKRIGGYITILWYFWDQ